MKAKLLLSAISAFLVATAFQNCGKVAFDKSGRSSSAQLTSLDVASDSTNVTNNSDPAPQAPPAARVSEDEDDDGSSEYVACILVDSGKSLKLGIIQGDAIGVNSVAQSACVTRHGCLDLVSKKFQVEGTYGRGYCDHNPNVVRLDDQHLAELLK